MSERIGWRVEHGRWCLGDVRGFEGVELYSDGSLDAGRLYLRLSRAEARTLAALLLAYADTGTIPTDGAVPPIVRTR